ncbi:MAG: HNH endonuclease [Gemmatimonadetes bacterium]|nr:HNH endonuclease [Gemmatimonadota bacterium]
MPLHPLGAFQPSKSGRPRSRDGDPSCRGGSTKRLPTGYVLEYSPDHPGSARSGHVYQHRLVAECSLGRLLLPGEQVHHRNEIPWDNRPENLEVLSTSEHCRRHSAIRYRTPMKPLTDDQVHIALAGRTIRAAVQLLGCSVTLLYARFRHLLQSQRASSTGHLPSKPDDAG